jgi:hypothetical protein
VGYRRGSGGWEDVPFDPYGAFAPMGGIYSCVRDLSRWVTGFASALPPGGTVDGGTVYGATAAAHPLATASRREMQLPQVVIPSGRGYSLPGGLAGGPGGYGFGLFIDEDAGLGRIVSHSGGYPGFGSNMRWHPATGTGVIALGNGTYAPMTQLTSLLLEALVPRRSAVYQLALAPGFTLAPGLASTGPDAPAGGPWPETLTAREAVSHLLFTVANRAPGDPVVGELFAAAPFTENVALDRPYPERARDIGLLFDRIGVFVDDVDRPFEHDTPAHCRWFLHGEYGQRVQAQIQLSPQRPPRVQSLTLAIPPADDSPLARTLDSVVAWLNSGSASWPESVTVAPGVDVPLLARRLRMAAIWTGTVTTGAYRAGDGAASVTVELAGEHAAAILALSVDSVSGALRGADVTI